MSAPTCALMSPIRSSATRMLFSTMSTMSWHNLAAPDELHRRQAQAFLLDLGRLGGKAARHHAAGVGPVAGIRQIAPQPAAIIERPHHLDVHQMGAAEIGIVDQDDVARFEVVAPLDHCLGGELHHADEDRQAEFALRDRPRRSCGW